jgi:hypothetical protein
MSQHRPTAATASAILTIASLAIPPRIGRLGPLAGRYIYALRMIALHERIGRDPVPELAVRLSSVEVAAKALILTHTISAVWPEDIHASPFCCGFLSHDEATIGAMLDAAAKGDRVGFEAAIAGLIRPDRAHRLWEASLALVAAEMRAL